MRWCRRRAVRQVQAQLPRCRFLLRTDVQSYYASIDHVLLMDRLARFIRDRTILNLCGQYMKRTCEQGGWFWNHDRGISLGCPLSPLIGAFFLDELDARMERSGPPSIAALRKIYSALHSMLAHSNLSSGSGTNCSQRCSEKRTKVRNSMRQSDLIFDVGMHLGEDTDFYLKKGFRVVAFEANADFVRHCQARFADAIKSGRLAVVQGAIAPGSALTVPFYVNTINSHWGTLNPEWVARNERRGAPSRMVEVRRIDIVEHFRQYGMPYYLKIDIEGSDTAVVAALKTLADRPQFISIETEINHFRRVLWEIELLQSLGYRKFKPVQQHNIGGMRLVSPARDGVLIEHVFGYGASGPFGDDLPGEWLDFKDCCRAYRTIFGKYWAIGHLSPFYRRSWRGVQRHIERFMGVAGWHDLHATL